MSAAHVTPGLRPILIAAGGTGGHMFPALAVAEALERRGRRVTLLTDRRGARYVGTRDHRVITAGSPSGGLAAAARGIAQLMVGAVQATALLARDRPGAAACFGGYACVPAGLAASLGRAPVLVHEQNAVFGRANRLVARFARVVALSYAATRAVPAAVQRRLVTGNPVRAGFPPPAGPLAMSPAVDGGLPLAAPAEATVHLLVLGGSQGARVFSDLVPTALAALPETLRARVALAQQCRPEDLARAQAACAALGLARLELAAFFTDVARRMAQADLVIARAGASTVAELLATGKPAILVPYPHAADDHQTANAAALGAAGAALCLPQQDATADRLAQLLGELLGEPARLATMAAAARDLASPEAADTLAATLIDLAGDQP